LATELLNGEVERYIMLLQEAVDFIAAEAEGLRNLIMGNLLLTKQFDEKRLLGSLIQVGSGRPKPLFDVLWYLEGDRHTVFSAVLQEGTSPDANGIQAAKSSQSSESTGGFMDRLLNFRSVGNSLRLFQPFCR
jgi:hypothetical protein